MSRSPVKHKRVVRDTPAPVVVVGDLGVAPVENAPRGVNSLLDMVIATRLVELSELQLNAVVAYAHAAREMPEDERHEALSAMVRAMGPRPANPLEDIPDAE